MVAQTGHFNLGKAASRGERKPVVDLERDGLRQVIPAQDTLFESFTPSHDQVTYWTTERERERERGGGEEEEEEEEDIKTLNLLIQISNICKSFSIHSSREFKMIEHINCDVLCVKFEIRKNLLQSCNQSSENCKPTNYVLFFFFFF